MGIRREEDYHDLAAVCSSIDKEIAGYGELKLHFTGIPLIKTIGYMNQCTQEYDTLIDIPMTALCIMSFILTDRMCTLSE